MFFVDGRTRNERYFVFVLVAIFRRLKMWHRLYFVPSDGAKIKLKVEKKRRDGIKSPERYVLMFDIHIRRLLWMHVLSRTCRNEWK